MRVALRDLKLERLDVVYAGNETFALSHNVRALGLSRVLSDLEPLAGGDGGARDSAPWNPN